jgi:hypothetical protein
MPLLLLEEHKMRKIEVSMTDGATLIPSMAYCATFDDYDGAEDAGFQPMGYGATEQEAIDALLAEQADHDADNEPHGSYDLSDDGDALASAGWGTDEDYGGYNDDF